MASTDFAGMAETVFGGLGTDSVMAADVYKVEDSSGINAVFGAAKEVATDTVDGIRKRPGILAEVVQLAGMGTGKLTKADMTSRVINILGSGGGTALKKLSDTTLNTIFGAMGVSAETTKDIKVALGAGVGIVGYSNVSDVQSMTSILGMIAGNSELAKAFDLEAEAALFTGILSQATSMGAFQAFDMIKEHANDNYTWQSAYQASAGQAILASDLTILNKIISELGVEKVLADNPNAVEQLITNYRLANGTTVDQYPTKWAELNDVLTKLNIHWWEYLRNGTWIANLGVFTKASDDAKKLLYLNEPFRTIALTAPFYQPTTAVNLGKAMYPNAAIGTTT